MSRLHLVVLQIFCIVCSPCGPNGLSQINIGLCMQNKHSADS